MDAPAGMAAAKRSCKLVGLTAASQAAAPPQPKGTAGVLCSSRPGNGGGSQSPPACTRTGRAPEGENAGPARGRGPPHPHPRPCFGGRPEITAVIRPPPPKSRPGVGGRPGITAVVSDGCPLALPLPRLRLLLLLLLNRLLLYSCCSTPTTTRTNPPAPTRATPSTTTPNTAKTAQYHCYCHCGAN